MADLIKLFYGFITQHTLALTPTQLLRLCQLASVEPSGFAVQGLLFPLHFRLHRLHLHLDLLVLLLRR